MNAAKNYHGGSGIQTAALAFGGSNPAANDVQSNTEAYDGTNWTTTASMATARRGLGPATNTGGIDTALAAGGYNGTANVNSTEEFTDGTPSTNVKTITTS